MLLSELHQKCVERAKDNKDVEARMDRCHFTLTATNGIMVATPDGVCASIARGSHAERQLLTRLGIPSSAFDYLIEHNEYDTALRIVNKRAAEDKKVRLFRLRADTVRAVLSDRYAAVENAAVTAEALEHMGDTQVHRWSVKDDVLRFMVRDTGYEVELPDGSIAHHTAYVENSETGTHKLRCLSGIFRLICTNGMTVGIATTRYQARHIGRNGTKFMSMLTAGLSQNATDSAARRALVASWDKVVSANDSVPGTIVSIADRFGIHPNVAADTVQKWKTYSNVPRLYGIIDGLTRAAQWADDTDDINETAGKIALMSDAQWSTHLLNGRSLPAEVAKRYALAL